MAKHPPIAVVGMGGIFPGASDLTAFWDNIVNKVDTVDDVPPGRWILEPEAIYSPAPSPGKVISKRACLIEDFTFDPVDLDLDRSLIDALDPLYQLVLHAGRQALLNCNTPINRKRTGTILATIALPTDASSAITRNIFGGTIEETLADNGSLTSPVPASRHVGNGDPFTPAQCFGSKATGFPGAILARALGLGAGSFTLDAACASSLYAVKLACDELSLHRADTMLAGGVSRPECLYTQVGFSQLRALSPSGRCSPFDESADGLVVGEGAGIMVLKRYDDARRDGDSIYGVIRGIGLSNDLRGNLLAPDSEGQVRAMANAYKAAGWSPRDVDLIECHGAGTPVGDAIELQSLKTLWDQAGGPEKDCAIGSVKSMIGHLLTGAGAAGMIKTLLALSHEILPPSLNFNQAPADSPIHGSCFRVQCDPADWPAEEPQRSRRAAVSAFGFGGINGHLLIEACPSGTVVAVGENLDGPASEPHHARPHPTPMTLNKDHADEEDTDIAIVGMECVFGTLPSLRDFQEAVFKGESMVGKRPDNRWRGCETRAKRHVGNAASYGGYLTDFDFDFGAFHIPPNEIPDILPQHLLMLKVAAAAMADAGLPLRENRPNMGVIIGMGFDFGATDFHLRWSLPDRVGKQAEKRLASLVDSSAPLLTPTRTLGALGGLIASRIAREFRFGGPSFVVSGEETSGLQALKIASRFLYQKDLDAVLVGAVDLTGDVRSIVTTHPIRSYSEQQYVKPFDRSADGTLPGEGAGAIVVKRLDAAIRDGDRIYAVVKGFGLAGSGSFATEEPSGNRYMHAYTEAFSQALADADIRSSSIGLMEAHGSGDPLEDRMESEALERIFARDRGKPDDPCAIGSVASIIGHTGAVSGLASLIKACLCLYQEIIPPLPRFRSPQDDQWQANRFHIPAFPGYWVRNRKEGPRHAGVGAVTADGNVMHTILQAYEYPSTAPVPDTVLRERKYPMGLNARGLFCVEAGSRKSLIETLNDLDSRVTGWRTEQIPMESAARLWYEQAGRQPDKKYGIALVAGDFSHLHDVIDDASVAVSTDTPRQMNSTGGVSYAPSPLGPEGDIAFVYPGSGNHYIGMGRGIGLYWPEVLRQMDGESDALLSELLPDCYNPRRTSWMPGWEQAALERIRADPLNMIIGQVAHGSLVTHLIDRFDIRASAVIGYSLGESAGLFATGAWADREIMMSRMREGDLFKSQLAGPCNALREAWNIPADMDIDWRVAVVNRPADAVRKAIEASPHVRLLIVNTRDQCVIGGQKDPIALAIKQLACEAVYLDGVVTVHSDAVQPVADAYEALHVLPTVPPGGIRFYSCAMGRAYDLTASAAASSICRQAVSGFDFPVTVRQAYEDGIRIFFEMGPHTSCTGMINHILDDSPHLALSACVRGEDDYFTILKCLGALIAERIPVDLDVLYGDPIPSQPVKSDRSMTISVAGATLASVPAGKDIDALPRYPIDDISQPASTAMPPPSSMERDSKERHPLGGIVASMARTIEETADAHEQFLEFSTDLSNSFADTLQFQTRLLLKKGQNIGDYDSDATELPEVSGVAPPLPATPVLFSRDMCMEFATGSIARVLGPEFAPIDTYPYRVRLPDEPLMLVDRILAVEGKRGILGPGRVVTEHDVLPDAWYLDGGRAPVCIAVEAGQADLFLSAYLGIDHVVKGERVYRLLDATVEFHRDLPRPGDVIRYDITIEKFVRQGETHLFFFNFRGYIGDSLLITMTDGCAGFFTHDEVDRSGGIIPSQHDNDSLRDRAPVPWQDLVPVSVETYDDAGVDALRRGDLLGCFGSDFAGIDLGTSLRLPGGRMKLIDRILEMDPEGGRFGLGTIRAEADIHPEDWFLICHFVDDRVMPGTLMYECCAHSLRVFMQRIGWVSEDPEAGYEPVAGVRSILKCRGPVTPDTHHVHYVVEIKEIGYAPEPYVIADADMYADGLHIVSFTDMAMKMTHTTRQDIEALWQSKRTPARSHAPLPDPVPLWDRDRIVAFCTGNPSEAFGDRYRCFDRSRFIARLPGHPFLFMDRITRIEPEPWVLKPDGWVEAEFDLSPDAWYFRGNRMPALPLVALLEIALQPCGWLAAHVGSALRSENDLKFRNLGGTATLHRHLPPCRETLTARSRLTAVSEAGGLIIEDFEFEITLSKDRESKVYTGQTNFGYFSREAMARQIGIRDAEKRCYTPDAEEMKTALSHRFDDIHPLTPEDMEDDPDAPRSIPAKALRMIDTIDVYLPRGGSKGLGFLRGSKRVDPDEWFFKAHFYQDPVCPGSLGIESFIQLLRFFVFDHWKDIADDYRLELITDTAHRWTYRGQILPENETIEVEAEITHLEDHPFPMVLANGWLKVDGLCIYEMKDFGLQLIPTSKPGAINPEPGTMNL